jgi:Ca-activated chloride channel family protein
VIAFARPALLWLAAALPLAGLALAALWVRRRRRAAASLADAPLLRRLAGEDLRRVPHLRVALVPLALLSLGVAAAGPRWGTETEASGGPVDVALVLDASNSMRVTDVAPSRLDRERAVARALLREMRGERVGLLVFAGSGLVLAPLTSDEAALRLYVETLDPEVVTQTGSSLSSALRRGTDLLLGPRRAGRGGAVVLLTDGDALEERDAVLDAARRARRLGIAVHAVGIGTAAGGPVPDVDPATGRLRGVKTDPATGAPARSALGAALLRDLARASGGSYRAVPSAGDTARVAQAVADAARRATVSPDPGSAGEQVPGDRTSWFVAVALALLAVDGWTSLRRGRRAGDAMGTSGAGDGDDGARRRSGSAVDRSASETEEAPIPRRASRRTLPSVGAPADGDADGAALSSSSTSRQVDGGERAASGGDPRFARPAAGGDR